MPSSSLNEVIDEWDVNFINDKELDNIFDLINASNYKKEENSIYNN